MNLLACESLFCRTPNILIIFIHHLNIWLQIRFGEIISLLYFNPWASGTAGSDLPRVDLSHRPVYLTSHGPSGKSSLLRLLLARTKLRQQQGVSALLGPMNDEDDEPAVGGTDPGTSGAPQRSATVIAGLTAAINRVDPNFLPFLSTYWLAMPRAVAAGDFQVCVYSNSLLTL